MSFHSKIYDIEHWIFEAEKRWGLTYKRKGHSREAAGPCFQCGGRDRFIVFENGGYWCRQCDVRGWVNENQNHKPLSPEILAEIERKRAEREEWERARHLAATERMAVCKDHLRYHRNMPAEAFDYWLEQGITIESMSNYILGYCPSCPTDGRPSYTIPVVNGNILRNIRHRLIGSDGNKYRPHMAGLGVQLFNMDLLTSGKRVIVVEGAKKAIILTQGGFPAVAVMGQNTFMREWLPLFNRFREVIVALDPDATESAYRLAALFDGRGKVASFPTKPDDALVLYGAGAVDIEAILEQARPVGRKNNGRSRSV